MHKRLGKMVEGAGGKDRQWNACGQGGLGRSPHGAVSAGHPQHLGPRRRALHHLRHVVVGGESDHRDVGQVALHPGQHVVPLAAVRRRIDLGGAEHETGRDVRRVVGTGRHPREAHQAGQRGQGHAQRGYLECHRAREGGRTGRVTAGKRGRGGNAPGDARERYPQQRWAWPPVQPFGHLVGDQAGGGQGGETAAGGSPGPRRAGEGEHGGQPHPQLGVVGRSAEAWPSRATGCGCRRRIRRATRRDRRSCGAACRADGGGWSRLPRSRRAVARREPRPWVQRQ